MKLYIANCTKQYHSFVYRLPETKRVSTPIKLNPGEQKLIGADKLSQSDIDAIISHHRQYGMLSEKEVKRSDNYVGLCYSIGDPVSLDGITMAFDVNAHVLNEIARDNLSKAAIASSVNDTTANPKLGKLNNLSIEVVEQSKPGQTGEVALGVEVARDGIAPKHREGKKGNNRLHA